MSITTSSIDPSKQALDLQKIPARSIDELLFDMVKIGKLFKLGLDVDVPFTTFHLKSGRDLSGRLINLNKEKDMITIYNSRISSKHTERTIFDSSYISISSVESITIHNSSIVAHLISNGQVASPEEGSPLSFKEIKDKLSKFEEFFKSEMSHTFSISVDFDHINEDSVECMNLMNLIRNSLIAVYCIIVTKKEKLEITEIQFLGSNDSFSVLKSKEKILIGGGLKESKNGWTIPHDIANMIGKCLK